ncbi:hypothetical protein [Butyrivibrio sp. INlla21]|uniref:hypothetical protein n=1 Tax=Butyrivibrio sp. INlla21 TaxID=1520811 RepID=UPI0008EA384E|nr:hypothetical protein [Butyrivibrio sp. INlla21]SFU94156.1 hypothetical protein SAMN02910342_02508 [Butyrivibrio sp. INlla21]
MTGNLKELIADADRLIIGIGSEWNWVKNAIKKDDRYNEILDYCSIEENSWLKPIVEYEYAYYNNDEKIEEAYKGLLKLIGDKKFFLVSDICLWDAPMFGFDVKNCVYPCGNYMYLQTDSADGELFAADKNPDFMETVNAIHKIITEDNGSFDKNISFKKAFFEGNELYINQKRPEYSKINYNEIAYKDRWSDYLTFLSRTLNFKLVMLELGVGLEYPTVVRLPFENVVSLNKKAHLIRVHEKLYQATPEIKEKTDSVKMNSVDYILQESR